MRLLVLAVLALLAPGCKVSDGISRELGAACRNGKDCEDMCLPAPRWPQGFCSRTCTAASGCPVGAECVGTEDGDVCLFACFDDRDCVFLEQGGTTAWKCRDLSSPAGVKKACAPEDVS